MGTSFLTKEARIYNGAKTASSTNGAGKIGQLHGTEEFIFMAAMEKHTMFLDWKNQYSENECTSQSNL